MTITLDLQPEIERGLLAQAQAKGVSLADLAHEILAREARVAVVPALQRTGQDLVDVCARIQGVLTDEEVDKLFRRNPLPARPLDLE
jgi:hypothetical protein